MLSITQVRFIEPDGLKPGDPSKPGTHFWFREAGAAIGLGFGVVVQQRKYRV